MGIFFCIKHRCEYRVEKNDYITTIQCENINDVEPLITKTKCNSCDKNFTLTYYYCKNHRQFVNPKTYDKCLECKSQIYMSQRFLEKSDLQV